METVRGTKRKFTDEISVDRVNKRKLQSIEQHAQRMAKARKDGHTVKKTRKPLQDISNGDITLINPSTPESKPIKKTTEKTCIRQEDFSKEYDEEIMLYEIELEKKTAPRNWLELQPKVNAEHRSILLNWLFTVHASFGLLPETFHICINIMDRFLSKKPISLEKYQLTALASLWIACKTQESVSPSYKDLLFVCSDGYTPGELRKAESYVLNSLDWVVGVDGWSGLYNWLARLNKTDGNDWHVGTLARYLSEAFIVGGCRGQVCSIVVSGRLLACASTWLARKMWALSLGIPWEHVEWTDLFSGYLEGEVERVAKDVMDTVATSARTAMSVANRGMSGGNGFEEVYKLYAKPEFCGVSLWVDEWVRHYL
jgi:hypothetical protein